MGETRDATDTELLDWLLGHLWYGVIEVEPKPGMCIKIGPTRKAIEAARGLASMAPVAAPPSRGETGDPNER